MCKDLTKRAATAIPLGILVSSMCLQDAHAQGYMALQYNDSVRIVLSNIPCSGGQGWRATAQRIDKQYLRACWTREPHEKLIRVQWEGGDFSIFDTDRFNRIEAE